VDTAWLLRLKEKAANDALAMNDFNKVAAQLRRIVKAGHYVFNHLHPHWLDAEWIADVKQWELRNHTRYRFANLDKTAKDYLFEQSLRLLMEIIQPANPGFVPDGFRAGGWSIQPFSDFKPYFLKYGIKYDFSVMPGLKSITAANLYDYSALSLYEPYMFSNDPAKPEYGEFVEFPISSIPIAAISKLLNKIQLKYLWWKGDRSSGEGVGVVAAKIEEPSGRHEMISIELLTQTKLPLYLSYLAKNDFMQFISHAKMVSQHNIHTFKEFVNRAFSLYTIESDFRKVVHLPEEISLRKVI
jgi:hypothetical protein